MRDKWETVQKSRSTTSFTWGDGQLVEEIIQYYGGGAATVPSWETNIEKKKKLIQLICKIKGEKYIEEKECIKNIKISVKDIKMVVKAVKGIELNII